MAGLTGLPGLGSYSRLNLVPFIWTVFLWYMAVPRNWRVGLLEDRFFATVFLGSGLPFVAMLSATVFSCEGLAGHPSRLAFQIRMKSIDLCLAPFTRS